MEWSLLAATFGLLLCKFQLFWGWGNSEHKQAADKMGGVERSLPRLHPKSATVFYLLKTVLKTEQHMLGMDVTKSR